MASGPRPYLSYLLRLWLAEDGGTDWRGSLENPITAERHGFSTLGQLIAFLQAVTNDVAAEEAWDRAAGGSRAGADRHGPAGEEGRATDNH